MAQKWKFLGQERQEELGLNWDSYKWRNADPALGRFFGVDPIAEDYPNQTPYQFASNNPVWKVEIEGLEGIEGSGEDWMNGLGYGVDPGDGTAVEVGEGGLLSKGYLSSALSTAGDFFGKVHEGLSSAISGTFTSFFGTAETNNSLSDAEFNDAIAAGDENAVFTGLEQESAGALNAIPEILGEAGAMAVEGAAGKAFIGPKLPGKGKGLGNPFKNKSVSQVNRAMNKHVKTGKLEAKHSNPVSGSNSFKNTKSGFSYNVDTGVSGKTGVQVESPHIDVNYPNPKPKMFQAKRNYQLKND